MNIAKVAVITVIANSRKWLDTYLESLLKTKFQNYFIIIVDNNSKDGGADFFVEKSINCKKNIKIIKNKRNIGFAGANNIAIKYALREGASYVVLLNPDTKVDPLWLDVLIEVADSDNEAGILSPLQYDYDGRKINDLFLSIFMSESPIFEDLKTETLKDRYAAKSVVGAAMLVKRDIFCKVGYFDTMFFLYGEEFDFCRRALFNNFKIYVVTKSIVYHWGAFSHPESLTKMKKYYYWRGNFLYFLKNPYSSFPKLICAYYFMEMFKIAQQLKLFGDFSSIVVFLKIQLWIISHLPFITWRRYRDKRC